MTSQDAALRASVRAYLARDWGAFERLRDRDLVVRRARGARASWHVMDQLRASARALRGEWPTEADREADLEDHRRLAATLARTAGHRRSSSGSTSGLRGR